MPRSDADASDTAPVVVETVTDAPAATPPAAPADAPPLPAREPESHTLSRKRDREVSLEPSAFPQSDAVSTKKNRRLDSDSGSDRSASPSKPSPSKAGEDEGLAPGVGQIRKQVQDLDWQEKEGKDRADSQGEAVPEAATESDSGAQSDTESAPKPVSESQKEDKEDKDAKVEKDKPASGFAAFASKSAPAAPAPKTTQPTFASFTSSSNSSPFVTGASGSKSWLASSTPAAPGLRPSGLGSSLGKLSGSSQSSSPASASPAPIASPRSPASASSAKGKAAMPSTASLGFGSFASGSGFAYAATSSPFSSAAATVTKKAAAKPDEAEDKKQSSFVTALEESGTESATPEETGEAAPQKPKLEAKAENYWTGEEDETNVFSGRAKLFTRAGNGAWRERGTGTIRVNIPKDAKGAKGGRLVMRADGVLRVILNVKLFAGMHCELEQEKFMKVVALEDGELVTFAIRFPNPSVAVEFKEAVEAHKPAAPSKE